MFQLITFIVCESYKELLLRNALRSLVYILFVSLFSSMRLIHREFVRTRHPACWKG